MLTKFIILKLYFEQSSIIKFFPTLTVVYNFQSHFLIRDSNSVIQYTSVSQRFKLFHSQIAIFESYILQYFFYQDTIHCNTNFPILIFQFFPSTNNPSTNHSFKFLPGFVKLGLRVFTAIISPQPFRTNELNRPIVSLPVAIKQVRGNGDFQ